ncbi:hypothetical protein SDC9_144588 [bioreactor metagenome]|uniref:Uncharacterized protein n=1 Tax=bioreactor metagenome TaxID=1076179 RepID=A0A645E7F0_9ZZZZ
MGIKYLAPIADDRYAYHQPSADAISSLKIEIYRLLPLIHRNFSDESKCSQVDCQNGDSVVLEVACTVQYRPISAETDDQVRSFLDLQHLVFSIGSKDCACDTLLLQVVRYGLRQGMRSFFSPVRDDEYTLYRPLFHS